MSALLIEAIRSLRLRPGQVYRANVDGQTVEVRVTEGEAELAGGPMLEPWVDFPFEPTGSVPAQAGAVALPDPPVLPTDEDVWCQVTVTASSGRGR